MVAAGFNKLQSYRRKYGILSHASHIIEFILLSVTDVCSTVWCTFPLFVNMRCSLTSRTLLSITNKMQSYTIFFIISMSSIDNNNEYCITLHLVGYT